MANLNTLRIRFIAQPNAGDEINFIDPDSGKSWSIVFDTTAGIVGNTTRVLIGNSIDVTLVNTLGALVNIGGKDLYRYKRDFIEGEIDVINFTTNQFVINSFTPGRFTVLTGTTTEDPRVKIESLTPVYDEANGCNDYVSIRLISSSLVKRYELLVGTSSNSFSITDSRDFNVSVPRNTTFSIKVHSNVDYVFDEVDTQAVSPINKLELNPVVNYNLGKASIDINHTFNEAVNVSGVNLNTVGNYSIGAGIQSSKFFQDVADGTYTLTARDGFGCQATSSALVDISSGVSTQVYFVEFPYANSFHWAKDETIDCSNYIRLDNTLSWQEKTLNNKNFAHLVQKCDSPSNQFKSTYNSHKAYLNSCGFRIEIPIIQKTNNLSKTDSFDVVGVSSEGNNTSFIFESNTIPFYIKEGNQIEIEGEGTFTITGFEDITYRNARAMTTNRPFNNALAPVENYTIKYTYQFGDYDVFEIKIDCSSLEGKHWIELECYVGGQVIEVINSEVFNVQEEHEETYYIIASNSVNNEINYSTGIKHLLRLKYELTKTYAGEDEIDSLDTDSNIIHLESRVKDTWRFDFTPVPTHMIPKLIRVLSLDQLYINKEGYIKIGSIETERIGVTNLYTLSVVLAETKRYFNTNSESDTILNNQTGFVKIDNSGLGFIDSGSGGNIGA